MELGASQATPDPCIHPTHTLCTGIQPVSRWAPWGADTNPLPPPGPGLSFRIAIFPLPRRGQTTAVDGQPTSCSPRPGACESASRAVCARGQAGPAQNDGNREMLQKRGHAALNSSDGWPIPLFG